MKALALMMIVLVGCGGEHRDARDLYNEGVAALASSDLETAEKKLLDARSAAGVDPELRFQAAYDLGIAYAAHADKLRNGQDADLSKALELAQQAASWFSDAQRLRPDDGDTKANLAIVRARVQSISDELRKEEGKLEARLDALIAEQRGVLDDTRQAWMSIKQSLGLDPLAQQGALTHLADRERGVVAEAGVITDLAADEIDAIGKKPEDKRTDQEKVRVLQLKNVDVYVLDARTAIAEARRKLQDLAAEDALARAETALVALKRAREQLLDPITVMKLVAQDEAELAGETAYASASAGTLELAPDVQKPTGPLPAWMQAPAMADRQSGVRDRLEELRARLAGAVETPQDPQKPLPPEQAKMLERVAAALPSVVLASAAMERAHGSLGANKLPDATAAEGDALLALSNAIEQFSDLKQLTELAHAEQEHLVQLLGPEGAKVDPKERAKQTKDGLARNVARMPHLQELIADQLAQADKQPEDPKTKDDPKAKEAREAQIKQMKEMLGHAEELRGEAEKKLGETAAAIQLAGDPLAPATEAEQKLDELRRLFFNVVEHLQQLIRDQGDTRDQTTQIAGMDDLSRAPKLPAVIGKQDGHGQMAKAITDALAAQADAAGKQQGPSKPGQPDPKTLAAAADEVRQAQGDMGDAGRTLVKARDAKTQSESLDPATKAQAKALEHLQKALELLQPPKQNQNKKQDQQKQDQQKQDQQKKQDQQQQKGGASQRARDEDAKRQKERQKQQGASDPVDKDW